jgi:hypothetical protein
LLSLEGRRPPKSTPVDFGTKAFQNRPMPILVGASAASFEGRFAATSG